VSFENNTYTINYDSTIYTTFDELNAYYTADNWVAIRSSVILLVVSTLLNVATIFFYAKQPINTANSTGGAPTSAAEQSVERRLLIFSVLNFLCQLLMALWWVSDLEILYTISRIIKSKKNIYCIHIFGLFIFISVL
jgi:hypothetical protein